MIESISTTKSDYMLQKLLTKLKSFTIEEKWNRWREREKTEYMEIHGNGFPYKYYHKISRSIKENIRGGRFANRMPKEEREKVNALIILKIFQKCHFKCYYCGMTQETSLKKHRRRLSIDRQDSTKGYSYKNCVAACYKCDFFKGNVLNGKEMKKIAPIIWKAFARTIKQTKANKWKASYQLRLHIIN